MKSILIIASLIFLGFSNFLQKTPSDFDYELSDIARNFRDEVMNEDECEKQKSAAEELADEIEDALDMQDEYNSDEIFELKKLKKEAEALESFIAAVGYCGGNILSIDAFNLANQRVNASVNYVIKDKYCVDVILVTIDDYVAYLAKNNYSKNYTVAYKWKAQNGMSTGNGRMGISKFGLRHIYNNREKTSQKDISVFGITCKEF